MELDKIKKILTNGSFGVVFPKAKENEKAAMELAKLIEGARAVASFVDNNDENKITYGVIYDLTLIDQEDINDKM